MHAVKAVADERVEATVGNRLLECLRAVGSGQ
jgi:hypothetical protein